MKSLLLFSLVALLAGCTMLEKKPDQPKVTLAPSELMKQAKILQKNEQWSEALNLINSWEKQDQKHSDNAQIASLTEEIKRDWKMQKRTSEDWILVYETRSLQQKLPYLERLVAIDSENLITRSRLLFWKKLLESKVSPLISCGSMHLHLEPALAESCAQLAESIEPTQQSAHLLNKIKQTRAQEKSAAQTKKAVQVKRDLSQQRDRLLSTAIKQRDEASFQESINSLNKLLRLNPKDTEAKQLLEDVISERDQRVERLIKFGDALYRDEQIDQAVSVWESAEKMDEGRSDIASRIDRALKVLERLREIKEVQ